MTAVITKITPNNIDAFAGIMPASLVQRLSKKENGLFALGTVSDENMATGTVVCSFDGSILTIMSLYVATDFRGQGLELVLLLSLTDRAREIEEIARIEAHFTQDSDYDLLHFFEEVGFDVSETEESFFKVSLAQLKKSDVLNKKITGNEGFAFCDMDPSMLREIERILQESGSDFVRFPLSRSDIDKNLSAAFYQDHIMKSVVVFENKSEDEVTLSFAWMTPDSAAALMPLLRRAFRIAGEMFKGNNDAIINIPVVSDKAATLIQKLAGEAVIDETACSYAVYEFN
ncbi:MAG: GNAT family N-acetyltransferase [Oscillospiraceae bacterium]|nr:GNAT family N-acetyltransferase [Oscillospiraceae bacterium]